MSSFRKSLVAVAGLLVLVAALAALLPLAGRGQGTRLTAEPQPPMCGQRKFYLTKTLHNGSEALAACAAGYHMASLWEIHDPSNLKYNTALGQTTEDSGSGPPTRLFGWVRTGTDSHPGANCSVWTSNLDGHSGTVVGFVPPVSWGASAMIVSPWESVEAACHGKRGVWCVQD